MHRPGDSLIILQGNDDSAKAFGGEHDAIEDLEHPTGLTECDVVGIAPAAGAQGGPPGLVE